MSSKTTSDILVDVIGEMCPIPLVEMRKAVMRADKGSIIEIQGTHTSSKQEIPMAVDSLGLKLLKIEDDSEGIWHIYIQK